jgi:GTP-sensing pleiotropic transcriptional regulator CodY
MMRLQEKLANLRTILQELDEERADAVRRFNAISQRFQTITHAHAHICEAIKQLEAQQRGEAE